MSIQGTTLLTWTLMYAFAGTLYLNAFANRRVEPELSRFGYVCLAFALVSYARARLLAADSVDELLFAGRMAAIGRYLLGAAFVSLCASLSRIPSKLVPFTGLWASVGLILVATDAHGGVSNDESTYVIFTAGTGMFALGIALSGAALLDATRHRGYDPYVRRVVSAAGVCLVAAVVDAAISLLGYPRVDVLAHAGIIGVVMVHWTLLDRFGEATEKLSNRRSAYAMSLEDLSKKHEELLETEQLAAVGELSAVIAHEVRNPLAIIKNAASAMRKGAHGPEAQRRLVDILDEETERLHKLTFELGAFAEHNKPSFGECDLPAVLDHCVNRARAHGRSVDEGEMRFETRADVDSLVADRELLQSSIFYLIQNAMDASPPGATIRLVAVETDLEGEPAVEVRVMDEGEGMSQETLSKAKTPFFTTRSRGTGLALAIVDRIATNHGGRLILESREGAGTTARLVIPKQRQSLRPSFTGLIANASEALDGSASQ